MCSAVYNCVGVVKRQPTQLSNHGLSARHPPMPCRRSICRAGRPRHYIQTLTRFVAMPRAFSNEFPHSKLLHIVPRGTFPAALSTSLARKLAVSKCPDVNAPLNFRVSHPSSDVFPGWYPGTLDPLKRSPYIPRKKGEFADTCSCGIFTGLRKSVQAECRRCGFLPNRCVCVFVAACSKRDLANRRR